MERVLKTVLVLGSTGMAGHMVVSQLREKYRVIEVNRKRYSKSRGLYFDATDRKRYNTFFDSFKGVDYIVNCIGVLVEASEDDYNLAYVVNRDFPKFLETKFKGTKTKIIHISTDCVFDGRKGEYSPLDKPTETSAYGRSKACGEIINSKDVTIRTSIIGPDLKAEGVGLFNWFMSQSGEVKGYTNAFWSGISTIELARCIEWCIEEGKCGLQQISREKKVSKYELLQTFKSVFKKDITILEDPTKKIDKSLIPSEDAYPITTSYTYMVHEMKQYIENVSHKYTYLHYKKGCSCD